MTGSFLEKKERKSLNALISLDLFPLYSILRISSLTFMYAASLLEHFYPKIYPVLCRSTTTALGYSGVLGTGLTKPSISLHGSDVCWCLYS